MGTSQIFTNANEIWYNIRWKNGVHCVECNSSDYYKLKDGRYKCKKCGKIFSDTSGTMLHNSKIGTEKWLYAIWKMSNSKGISTIELSKDIEVTYKTAWMMQQKIRYAMKLDYINLNGITRMDEAYIGGWSGMHFNKKMNFMRSKGFISKDATRYSKTALMSAVSAKKHHIVSMMDENGRTKILHTPNPITKKIIKQIIENEQHITKLVTDESKLYTKLSIPVSQSNHSKHIFMTKDGLTSNINENIFSWVKRKWNGIYTHTSEKYLQLYLNQMSFAYNHIKENAETRFNHLLSLCSEVYVRSEEIYTYDYLKPYRAVFEDIYERERKEADELMDICLVKSVETKHHIVRKR